MGWKRCVGLAMIELNQMSYSSLNELFDEWKNQHKKESDSEYLEYKGGNVPKISFLPDGIIEEKQFNLKKEKGKSVLFIAKEAYWFSENDSEEKCLKALNTPMFWHREVSFGRVDETMFSKRLSMLINAYYSNDYEVSDKNHLNLRSCAVLNLNKRGGFAYCKWKTLSGYVLRYCKYIRKEIELINPDLIICCGRDVKWLLDTYICIDTAAKVVAVNHPSYFALSDAEYLNQFECSINGQEWKLKEKVTGKRFSEPKVKGIMFDTNKSYSETSTFDMLTSEKISAYDEAGRYIESFNNGDFVFYYVKGRGIAVAGEICSDASICDYHGLVEKYRMVKMISPINMPKSEEELKCIRPSRIKELLNHDFYWASTIKTPFLDKEQCEILLSELKRQYNE